MTIWWKAVEHYFTVVLFVFQFQPVCDFGKFISFVLGTLRSERVNPSKFAEVANRSLLGMQLHYNTRTQP